MKGEKRPEGAVTHSFKPGREKVDCVRFARAPTEAPKGIHMLL
jgi:hypothetical protein